jgi:hypothetical protein
MIRNSDRAFMALRNMPAVIANHPLGVAFFIHDNSDFFSLFKIFFDACIGQFGKIMIQFFGHIHKENVFIGMGEVFVVHSPTEDYIFPLFFEDEMIKRNQQFYVFKSKEDDY